MNNNETPDSKPTTVERQRLNDEQDWNLWGPYLADRAWCTVREDYSEQGTVWEHFPHDHARSRAYRWSEDGLGGLCDREQRLCLALALWNGRDPILKERAFGLTGNEGNRGEDVKEVYFYADETPTHSYLDYRYCYPQAAYPYDELVEENQRRSRTEPPYNLIDSGVFEHNRFWDVRMEYAKQSTVLACSALKQNYRQRLDPDPANVHFVHLEGDYDLILTRLGQRTEHFMPAELLRSQFADLEPCFNGLVVSVDQTPVSIVEQIVTGLGLNKQYHTTTIPILRR